MSLSSATSGSQSHKRKLTAEEHENRRAGARKNDWNHYITLGKIRKSKAWWAEILADVTAKPYRGVYNTLNSYTNRGMNSWDAVLSACFGSPVLKKMTSKETDEAKKHILEVAREKVKVSKRLKSQNAKKATS